MKRLSIFLVMALPLIFTSCEGGFEDLFNDIVSEATGNAEIHVLDYNTSDTLQSEAFEFSVASSIDTIIDEIPISYLAGFSSHTSLEEAEIDFPFMFYTLSDTVVGTHYVDLQLDTSFLLHFDYEEFVNTNHDNVMALIIDEDTWIIASSGSIELTDYEGYGGISAGSFSNMVAYRLTKSAIEEIQTLYDAGDFLAIGEKIEEIPVMIISGEFNSRNLDVLSFINNETQTDTAISK